jgi:hypothetical protein
MGQGDVGANGEVILWFDRPWVLPGLAFSALAALIAVLLVVVLGGGSSPHRALGSSHPTVTQTSNPVSSLLPVTQPSLSGSSGQTSPTTTPSALPFTVASASTPTTSVTSAPPAVVVAQPVVAPALPVGAFGGVLFALVFGLPMWVFRRRRNVPVPAP